MAKTLKKIRAAARKKAKGAGAGQKRAPAIQRRLAAHLASATLLPAPVGSPQPFSTPASASGNDDGHSTTTGLQGTQQKFDDGSIVIEATENLKADRTGGMQGSLTASCRRVQRGQATTVHQVSYSLQKPRAFGFDAFDRCKRFFLASGAGGLSGDVRTVGQSDPVRQKRSRRRGHWNAGHGPDPDQQRGVRRFGENIRHGNTIWRTLENQH